MYTGKEDDVGIGLRRLLRQGKTITYKISDFLYLGTGVIMGKDDYV